MNEKKTQPTGKFQVECDDNAEELINKILKLQEREEMASSRRFVHIVAVLMTIAITLLVGYSIYKNGASTESVLSTLLAFFSIFMSVFFYFKSDETSKSFYDSSYNFMKEASITLGRIEERFGAQLSNLNEKITQLNQESRETSEQIYKQEEKRDGMIDELMQKAKLGKEEESTYRKNLKEQDKIIRSLQRQQITTMQNIARLKNGSSVSTLSDSNLTYLDITKRKSEVLDSIDEILETGKMPENISNYVKSLLKTYECVDENGDIHVGNLMHLRMNFMNNRIIL